MEDVVGPDDHSLLMNHPRVHLGDTDCRLVRQSSQWVFEHRWTEMPHIIAREGGMGEAHTLCHILAWIQVSMLLLL